MHILGITRTALTALPNIRYRVTGQLRRSEAVEDVLPLGLKGVKGAFGHADGDLVPTLDEALVRLVGEGVERHPDRRPVLDVRLVLGVVQLRLHGRREDLDDLDARRRLTQLPAQDEDEVVQRRLGGAVVGAPHQGHEREAGRRVDEGAVGGRLLGLQEREERLGQREVGEVVGHKLLVDEVEVDRVGLGEVEAALDARVEEDAVEVRVRGGDVGGEVGDLGELRDVEGDGGDFVGAVLAHELVEVLLAAARCDHVRPVRDELFRQCFSDS